jgi:hypothetical protein
MLINNAFIFDNLMILDKGIANILENLLFLWKSKFNKFC